jgi:protein disulfide-isomerase
MNTRLGASMRGVLILIAIATALWFWWSSTAAPTDQGGVVRSAWLEDAEQAFAKAEETGRPVLVNFTGSDWCGWCVKLRNEVFDTGVFAAWANDHVVLLECDFPRKKAQAPHQREQNRALADRHGIEGFPTILVISAQGDEIARIGYRRGGATAWIADLENRLQRGGR